MGIAFEINSLEEMCDLMCGNVIPRQSRQSRKGKAVLTEQSRKRKRKTQNGNSEHNTRSPASVHSGVRGSIQSSPVECDRGVLVMRDDKEHDECEEIGCNCEEHDECEEVKEII